MIVIKKYSNRRLYDTTSSQYVNLQQIAELIRAGQRIKVLDAKDGEDLTQQILLQILLEGQGTSALLPSGLLHRMIRSSTDHPLQRMMLGQMAAGLAVLEQQLEAFERQTGWVRPDPPPPPDRAPSAERAPPPEPRDDDDGLETVEPERRPRADGELDDLRARLAALESRLARKDER